jgi:sarcosine oxidase
MTTAFDVIVAGLGGMGSAAAHQLAARGVRVLGLDQFTPPHDKGSSHGKSRVIRQAYYEDPAYVPLLLRAYELWEQLERESGEKLLTITGGLMIGAPGSAVVTGSLRSAKEHGLAHELLDTAQIRKRFPPIQPDSNTVALYESKAGFVRPEQAVGAHLDCAARRGATLCFEEEVVSWEASAGHVKVKTTRGSWEAGQLVITAGPWLPGMAAGLNLPFAIERQVQFWFEPVGGIEPFLPDRFPIYIWETEDGVCPYGFPAIDGPDGGVKVAIHHGPIATACTPQTIDRTVRDDEIQKMRACIAGKIPALDGRCLGAITCMYTNTPDGHFVIDRHPAHANAWVVSPCSGHGFKFCPVIGEIVADLVERGQTRHDIALFRLGRLSRPRPEAAAT